MLNNIFKSSRTYWSKTWIFFPLSEKKKVLWKIKKIEEPTSKMIVGFKKNFLCTFLPNHGFYLRKFLCKEIFLKSYYQKIEDFWRVKYWILLLYLYCKNFVLKDFRTKITSIIFQFYFWFKDLVFFSFLYDPKILDF